MIKSIQDARITDGIPRILGQQEWVQALSDAMGEAHKRTLELADRSQIYTAIDTAPEIVLDALAVNWKIDWYDTGFSVERKRRIVKAAMEVRRTMGTAHAAKLQVDSLYPGTQFEEWFEYGGEPGYFRIFIDISSSDEQDPVIAYDQDEMERKLTVAKRWSAHMESLSYMVRRAIKVSEKVTSWTYRVPECGTVVCGTYPEASTLGWSENREIETRALPEAFLVEPPPCGTEPEVSTVGQSLSAAEKTAGIVDVYAAEPDECGEEPCGSVPVQSTVGQSLTAVQEAESRIDVYAVEPDECGTKPQTASNGISITSPAVLGGSAGAYVGEPPQSGTSRCGMLP